MIQNKKLTIWPLNWPLESSPDYLKLNTKSAELHKRFYTLIENTQINQDLSLDDLDYIQCSQLSEWETYLTATQTTSNDLLAIYILNPLTISAHEAASTHLDDLFHRKTLVYAQCFVDTRWELLQGLSKCPYYYVLFFDAGILTIDITTELLQKDISNIPDEELTSSLIKLLNTKANTQEAAQQLLHALKQNTNPNVSEKHPKLFKLLTETANGAQISIEKAQSSTEEGQPQTEQLPTDNSVTLSSAFLTIRDTIIKEHKSGTLSSVKRLDLANLYGFFKRFQKAEDIFKQLLGECADESKAALYYLTYYFATISSEVDDRKKYLHETLEAQNSDLDPLLVTHLHAIQHELNDKRAEAVKLLNSTAEKQDNIVLKAVIYANTARVMSESNVDDQKNAINYYNKAFDLISSIEPKHIFLPFFTEQISQVHSQLHNYSKAKNILQERTLKLIESIYGLDSIETALMFKEIAVMYFKLDLKDPAKDYFKNSLAVLVKTPGQSFASIVESLNYLAIIEKDAGDRQAAFNYIKKGIKLLRKYTGSRDAQRAVMLNNIGELLTNMGDFNSALELIENALDINLNSPEKCYGETAKNYLNLGLLYKSMGHQKMAEDFFDKCVEIKSKLLGDFHYEIGALFNNLAVVHREVKDFDNALKYYQRSLDIFKRNHGENHPLVALSLSNMAMLKKQLGKIDEAFDLYNQSLEISRISQGEDNPDYAMTLNDIAIIHLHQGKEEVALDLMEKALEVFRKHYGEEHLSVQTVSGNVNYLKAKLKDAKEESKAKPSFNKGESKTQGLPEEAKVSKPHSPSYYEEEEKKEYRSPHQEDDLPPNIKKVPSKGDPYYQVQAQAQFKPQAPNQNDTIPDLHSVKLPEDYIPNRDEILMCLEQLRLISLPTYKLVMTDSRLLETFCMEYADAQEEYAINAQDFSEEGYKNFLISYCKKFAAKFTTAHFNVPAPENIGAQPGSDDEFDYHSTKANQSHDKTTEKDPNEENIDDILAAMRHGEPKDDSTKMSERTDDLTEEDLASISRIANILGLDEKKVAMEYVLTGRSEHVTLDYLLEAKEQGWE